MTARELVDRNVPRFRAMVERMNCSNDDFIRTTEERHHRSSQAIWQRMEKNGDIYLDKYAGWYSVRDEAYYAEDETHLNEHKVRIATKTGTPVEWVEEESYFFKLSAYQQKLLDLYARDPDYVLPKERLNEVASFVRGGLQDLSISRTTFDWGVRVPGNDKHIMYVWVDALTNYITAAGFPDTDSAKFKRYWPADLHVIGKDIVRFHAVYWPAFLMSAGVEVPRRIFSHGFLFNRGEKMSKSVGNVIDPFTHADAYGVDQFRYFFLREVPFGQDGNYSHEAIVNRINADLANDLGNLAQRSLTMIDKQLGGVLPKPGAFSDNDKAILAAADAMIGDGARAHEDAAASSGAQRGLGGGRRRQPLFRRRGALGAGQDRSGAAGHGALRHRRGAAAGRRSCASRSCRRRPASCSICSACRPSERQLRRLGGADQRIAAGTTLPAPAPVFPRYVEPEAADGARADAMLVDSHCHLDFPDFEDELDGVVARAQAAGIGRIVTISTRVRRQADLLAIAERFPDVFCSVGTHPHHAHEELDIGTADLVERARHPKVVAIGEAGLDYHYDNTRATRRSRASAPISPPRARPACRW